jgi:hypothetical protein
MAAQNKVWAIPYSCENRARSECSLRMPAGNVFGNVDSVGPGIGVASIPQRNHGGPLARIAQRSADMPAITGNPSWQTDEIGNDVDY